MEYFDLAPQVQARKYAFKCHRVPQQGVDTVYPVNSISFNLKKVKDEISYTQHNNEKTGAPISVLQFFRYCVVCMLFF